MDNPHGIDPEDLHEPVTKVEAPPSTAPVAPPQAPPAEEAKPVIVAPEKAAPRPPRKRRIRRFLLALLPFAIVAGCYVYVTGGQIMSTENAYVQADMVAISTDVSGIVSEIAVTDNQKVAAGDLLFKLDDQQFRFALEQADAQIGVVRNDLEALKASYRNMQGQIQQSQIDIDYYDKTYKRQQQLVTQNIASQATFDQAQHDHQSAMQRQALLKDQLAGIVANLNGNPDAPIEDHPRYKAAVAARAEAARQLAHTTVRASMSGTVTNVPALQRGQYLAAATTAFNLVSDSHVWVQASPKETELTYVRPGQKVEATVDTYPGEEWQGTVESISPASASSFSLLPAENSSGNWVKVVQRIPMRVRLETPADKPPLRVGMSVIINVDTGHARGLPAFLVPLFGRSDKGHG